METTPGAQETKEQKYTRILAEINALVVSARKALAIQPGASSAEGKPKQFKNNFFILFLALKPGNESENEGQTKAYLDQAQRLGEKWTGFLAQNQGLISEMDPALDAYKIHQKIVKKTVELLYLDRERSTTDIASLV